MREPDDVFEAAAGACKRGEIGEGEFLRRTAGTWRRLALKAHRAWRAKMPSTLDVEDVEQEVRLLALRYLRSFDASRGAKNYGARVVFCTARRIKRRLPIKLDYAVRTFSEIDGRRSRASGEQREDFASRLVAREIGAEELAASTERFDGILADVDDVDDAVVLIAIRDAGGDVGKAAARLYADPDAWAEFDFADVAEARAYVETTFARLARERALRFEARDSGEIVVPPDELFEQSFDAVEEDEIVAAPVSGVRVTGSRPLWERALDSRRASADERAA